MNGLNPSLDYIPRWDAIVGMGSGTARHFYRANTPVIGPPQGPWIEAAPPDDFPLVTQTHVSMIRSSYGNLSREMRCSTTSRFTGLRTLEPHPRGTTGKITTTLTLWSRRQRTSRSLSR